LKAFLADRVAQRKVLKSRVLPHLPVPWLWRLVFMYVFQFGFLDGRAGWTLCNFISTYEFLIHAKYRELRRLHGRSTTVGGLSVPEGQINSGVAVKAASAQPAARPVQHSSPSSSSYAAPASAIEAQVVTRATPAGAKVPVSVIIPTLNETKNLPSCLEHLKWAAEVVVVDSGSTDDTQKIAAAHGATVINFKWNGQWPKKKNWALRDAPLSHEWVLIVDADEWITPELADEIRLAIRSNHYVGYYVNRKFIFLGGWIKHCGYYPSWNLRLIKRGFGEYEQLTGVGDTGSGDNEVHEHVVAKGPVGYLRSDMLHFAFPTIHTFVEKHNRYSNWEAAVQYRGVGTPSAAVVSNVELSRRRRLKNLSRYLPFRPTLRFLYSYVWRGGFLDGWPGYVFCRLLAMYEYLSVAKYHELQRAETTDPAAAPAPSPGVASASPRVTADQPT
jgi:glycosyltransferase involved in cell wall biosynthesis